MAGESARKKAETSRARAERLIAQAERWEKGAAGEARTALALGGLGPEFTVLHDLAWPGRLRANIDHVVIGPTGVFVIDTKNWSGRVEVRGNMLRQNGYKRERELTSGSAAALAIGGLVPNHASAVFPVICMVLDSPVRATTQGVWVCSTENVADLIRSRPVLLGPDHVAWVAHQVRAGTTGNLDRPAATSASAKAGQRRGLLAALVSAACVFVSLPFVGAALEGLGGR